MLKKHFIPYKETIIRSISSCVNPEQLYCCADMTDRFVEQFRFIVTPQELNDATAEIVLEYMQKSHELHIY